MPDDSDSDSDVMFKLDDGKEEEKEEDEESVVERGLFSDDEEEEFEQEEEEEEEDNNAQSTALVSSQSSRSIEEWKQQDDFGAVSQVPRGFFERVLWKESDVKFVNNTDREVLFIIADEEFTLERTTKMNAGINDGDDDDDDNDNGFGLNFIPLNLSVGASMTTTTTRSALRTRCMPVAPRSHSTQHFQHERLTYVTAMTKDEDGEGKPWTRVHYENKVINSKRTKSLSFCRKHMAVSAYRVKQKPPTKMLQKQRSKKRIIAATSATLVVKSPTKRIKAAAPEPEIVD